MRRMGARLLLVLVIAATSMALTSPAAAKSESSWHLSDPDGFVLSRHRITSRTAFLDMKAPYPSEAWLVPWDWDDQPRRLPKERFFVGALEFEETLVRGRRAVTGEISFLAPDRPGDYAIVTCVVPCKDIAPAPGPTSLRVVADPVEERLRKELAERDALFADLEYRFHRSKGEMQELVGDLREQLRYLSGHASRLDALETAAAEEQVPRATADPRTIGGVGLLSAALGFVV